MKRTAMAAIWPPTASIATGAGHRPSSPVQAIRRKCLDCCGGQSAEVRLCEATGCPLWPFRAGSHPYTKKALLEADFGNCAAEGTADAGNAAPAETPVQQAVFAHSEPCPAPDTVGVDT
jgi:hypothetical protein